MPKRAFAQANAAMAGAEKSTLVILAIAIGVAAILGFSITKMIVTPVNLLSDRMGKLDQNCLQNLMVGIQEMEQGDLTVEVVALAQPIEVSSKDEIGEMSTVFNSMIMKARATITAYEAMRESLTDIVRNIQSSASLVTSTSEDLSVNAQAVSEAAMSIAMNVEQVAHATEETAQSSQQSAQANEKLALTATEVANAMENLDSAIHEVKNGSEGQAKAAKEALDNVQNGLKSV